MGEIMNIEKKTIVFVDTVKLKNKTLYTTIPNKLLRGSFDLKEGDVVNVIIEKEY